MAPPLVSVGLPTYNGGASLARAIDSVLSQSYSNLELVVSDNASTDGTLELCEGVAACDPRVRYVRQPRNRGVTANFNAVVEEARGEYVLLLAHDDWLGPRYVERCLAVLQTTPGAVLAAGMTRAVRDGEIVRDWAPAHLVHPSGPRRVIDFYASGHSKADFYGMRPRSVHDRVGALHNFWGNDQVFVASLAFTGKLVCVPDVLYHRSTGGLSRDQAGLARAMELPTFQGRHPFATFAWYAATDVLWRSPAYRNLALPGRAALALVGVALYLDRRFGLRGRVRPKVRRYAVRTRLRLYREWRRVMRGPGRRARRRVRRGRRQAVKRLRRASRRVARLRRVVVRRLARLVG